MSDYPKDLKYTRDHEWARAAGASVKVGLTSFAVKQLGDVVMVELTLKVGDTIEEGAPFGTVESVKAVSEMFSPVTGTVKEINAKLNEDPELLNQDCYGEGWVMVVEAKDGALSDLMDAAAYTEFVASAE